jgi:hypothetical protein
MTATQQILEGINATRIAVTEANATWQPANVSRIEASLAAVETTLPGLRAALEAIPSAGPLPVAKLRTAAQALRDQAEALEFLVDAASAYIRCSPSIAAAYVGTYNVAGQVRTDGSLPTEAYNG